MAYVLRPYQQAAVNAGVKFLKGNYHGNGLMVLPTGCHAPGTKVVMYDLSVKYVEDVLVGDLLMGPDDTPRTVLQLCSGQDMMYRCTPLRGTPPFIINSEHILSLISTNEGKKAKYPCYQHGGEITNISVNNYLYKAKSWKHLRKLYRSGPVGQHINDNLPLDPWLLGVILGDGCTAHGMVNICNPDYEIIDRVGSIVSKYGCKLHISPKKHNNALSLNIVKSTNKCNRMIENTIMGIIRSLGLAGKLDDSKFIPDIYKQSSINTRLEILAGLLDTDGHYDKKKEYDFISKSKKLADDLIFIARSLGIVAKYTESYKSCQTGAGGYYHRVHLSGEYVANVPCCVERKKPEKRTQKKNSSRTGFSIEPIGTGDYYGFVLSGDHLYLTDDFMVHHNSGKSLIIANIIKELGEPTLIFQPSKEILEQNYAKYTSYGYTAGIFSASVGRKQIYPTTFATIGSVKNYAKHFRVFKYILIDESHLVSAKTLYQGNGIARTGMYFDFLKKLGMPKTIGLSATPYRLESDSDGSILKFLTRTRPRIFTDLIFYVNNKVLFDAGYLCPIKYVDHNSFDRTQLALNTTGADFSDRSVQAYYKKTNFQDKVLQTTKMVLQERNNVLVFTRFIKEAQYVADRLPGSAIVTAETKKDERERIIAGFRAGHIKAICNSMVLSIGFDYPELEAVILARPTMSLALYYQQCGRGIRISPNKKDCLVVDMCGNVSTFGKIEDLRIVDGGNGKWYVSNGRKQLTNVYFGRTS